MNFVPNNAFPAATLWCPDSEFVQKITELGILPFILLRTGSERKAARAFLVCNTQNDAKAFVQQLAELPAFSESKLLRGIELALRLEVYEAAESLFCWASAAPGPLSETVYFGEPDS